MSARTSSGRSGSVSLLAIAFLALSPLGCNSPTAPDAGMQPQLRLNGALVEVNGEVVNGESFQVGQMTGASTFFQATLMGPNGTVPGEAVRVQYRVPHQGPGGMMDGPAQGLMTLYDDGSHGDPTPGDGIYCYEDQQGLYGFHMHGAAAGTYHYEFFGVDHNQHHTGHMSVDVMLVLP